VAVRGGDDATRVLVEVSLDVGGELGTACRHTDCKLLDSGVVGVELLCDCLLDVLGHEPPYQFLQGVGDADRANSSTSFKHGDESRACARCRYRGWHLAPCAELEDILEECEDPKILREWYEMLESPAPAVAGCGLKAFADGFDDLMVFDHDLRLRPRRGLLAEVIWNSALGWCLRVLLT